MSAILVKIKPEYKSFLCDDGSMIVRLDKALYGCVESAKLWYDELCGTLLDLGYARTSACSTKESVRTSVLCVCMLTT